MKQGYSFMIAPSTSRVHHRQLFRKPEEGLEIAISCRELDCQLSPLAQVCHRPRLCLSFLRWRSSTSSLYLGQEYHREFLRSFTAVKVLHIDGELTSITSTVHPARGASFTGASRSRKARFEQTFPRNSSSRASN